MIKLMIYVEVLVYVFLQVVGMTVRHKALVLNALHIVQVTVETIVKARVLVEVGVQL